jgi:glycosyltransferase involved in cell wall biosynthesis
MNLVVVVPAYNAGETIEGVFARIPADVLDDVSEFVVVDDGSTDATREVVSKLAGKHKIELLTHDVNRGYGAAQKTGFDRALKDGCDLAVLLHSDGQYPPELIGELIKPIMDGKADITGGSRMLGKGALDGGMPMIRYIGNRLLTWAENLVFMMDVKAYHSGFKAYSRRALEKMDYASYSDKFYFDSEMYVGAKVNNLRIAEIPIPTRYSSEKSYLNPLTYGLGVLGVMARYLIKER